MSRKHFIALADALRAVMPTWEGENQPAMMDQWEKDVKAIGDVCKLANPEFNRQRWEGYIMGENGLRGGRIK